MNSLLKLKQDFIQSFCLSFPFHVCPWSFLFAQGLFFSHKRYTPFLLLICVHPSFSEESIQSLITTLVLMKNLKLFFIAEFNGHSSSSLFVIVKYMSLLLIQRSFNQQSKTRTISKKKMSCQSFHQVIYHIRNPEARDSTILSKQMVNFEILPKYLIKYLPFTSSSSYEYFLSVFPGTCPLLFLGV